MCADVYAKFYKQAVSQQQVIALLSDSEQISYGSFLRKVGGFQSLIESTSARKIAIHLCAGADAFAAMFAALSKGIEYAPLNVEAPADRIQSIVERYRPDIILAAPSSFDFFRRITDCRLIDPSTVAEAEAQPPKRLDQSAVAYTIFTSGSTGDPKGVIISSAGLNAYVDWIADAIPVQAGERWSQHPNIAFDLSVLDIYGALTQAATLVIAESSMDRLFPATFIQRHKINIWNSVPSIFALIAQSRQLTEQYLSSLRFITFCGEALPVELLKQIIQNLPNVTVQNTYGPTEATVSCTAVTFNGDDAVENLPSGSVTLGNAITGVGLSLDGAGDEGELIIHGDQVALGYLNEPQLTQQKFFTIHENGVEKRAFRTGDKVRVKGGQLYFVSRMDDCCKIKGHFIDLGGIESVLSTILQQNLACTVFENRVHLFIDQPAKLDLPAVRTQAATKLLEYELPVAIHVIEKILRGINDKIDRIALNKWIK